MFHFTCPETRQPVFTAADPRAAGFQGDVQDGAHTSSGLVFGHKLAWPGAIPASASSRSVVPWSGP